MNVADKELCKELYELSGWDETGYEYSLYDNSVIQVVGKATGSPKFVVAYPLGYLLRKLPDRTDGGKWGLTLWKGWNNGEQRDWYSVAYTHINSRYAFTPDEATDKLHLHEADTPENAVCKLAIELFKANILKKERDDEQT